jgi:hypothetical protein
MSASSTAPIQSVDVRSSIVTAFRRDLVGPGPQDSDLAKERLDVSPSRWYLAGFLAPADDPLTQDGPQDREDDPSTQEEMETDVEEPVDDGAGGAAGDAWGGGLVLETHARLFTYGTPDGNERARALTVFLVNRRSVPHRFYADASYVFQACLELACPQGFRPRRDISAYRSDDFDLRLADLHYREVCEYAVGRNSAAT